MPRARAQMHVGTRCTCNATVFIPRHEKSAPQALNRSIVVMSIGWPHLTIRSVEFENRLVDVSIIARVWGPIDRSIILKPYSL